MSELLTPRSFVFKLSQLLYPAIFFSLLIELTLITIWFFASLLYHMEPVCRFVTKNSIDPWWNATTAVMNQNKKKEIVAWPISVFNDKEF